MEYFPPFPERHEGRLPLPQLLMRASRSILTVWNTAAFRVPFIDTRILGRRILVLNDPAMIQAAFVEGAEAFERKSPQMRHALEPLLGDGLFISDGLVWKERRPQVQRVTHPSRLAALVPVMTQVASEWQSAWAKLPPGTVVDALGEMARFSAEVIARTLFGSRLGPEAARTVVQAFSAYQARVSNTDLLSLLGAPDFIPRLLLPRTSREAKRIHAVVDGLIDRVLREGGEASLIGAMAESGMDRRAFRNEAITLFMAGHETTANTLAWCWFLLSEHAESDAAVAEESRRVLGGRAAGHDDIAQLPWTRAVVEEALRLYPPVPLLAREVQRDTPLGPLELAKGTIVIVSPWLVHRHESHWEAPDAFRPARFLPGAPPPARYTYLPFSLGPRVCTGQHFGLYECIVALSTLAQHFRLAPVPGQRGFPVARLTTRPGESLPLRLEPRP